MLEIRDTENIRWASDPSRLLPGEEPESLFADDARHWIAVYSELLSFNRQLAEGITVRQEDDLPLMQAHIERMNGRLDYWQDRLDNLT
ncbi:MAG: hypothetical protein ABI401_13400 [Candidatus Dormibacter sp.]